MATFDDYAFTFGSEAGKRVLAHIIGNCHLGVASHVPGDSHETAFRDGERNIALSIIHNLERTTAGRLIASEAVLEEIREEQSEDE